MSISPAANQIIRHCKCDGHYLQKAIRVFPSGNREISFFLQPDGARVAPRDALEAVGSGWLTPRDPGLLDDPLLAQTWNYRARPAAGQPASRRRKEMATKFSVEIKSFHVAKANTLLGFANVVIPELRMQLYDLTVHQQGDARWVGMPARPQINRETDSVVRDAKGKIAYVPLLGFLDKTTREAFSDRVVEALAKFDPAIFDEATAA